MPPTSQDGQRRLCLTVYLPCSTCPKMLCRFMHTSFLRSPFLYLPLLLSPSLPHSTQFPTGDLFFSCGIWDPIQRAHYSVLILSRGWAPSSRMGDYRSPHTPTPHQPTLLSLPCDDVMAFICSGGTRWFSLGIKHSISPTSSPLPSLTFTTLFLSQSISQILWPLKGRLEDLGMFGCCFAHPWYMFDTQKKDNYPFQLRLPFYISLIISFQTFNLVLLHTRFVKQSLI